MRGAWALSSFGSVMRLSHLGDDFRAAVLGDFDRFLEHREREARQLEVELVAGDAFVGAAEFEVHIAVEILGADDVQQHLVGLHGAVLVVLGDEANGDTTDRADERDTGIKESHGACANGGHRGGAVGFHDLGGHTHGVWEILFGWDHRLDRALGKGAVADFAAVDATHASAFADGEWREVVVEDEALLVLAHLRSCRNVAFRQPVRVWLCRVPVFHHGRKSRNRGRVAGCRLRRRARGDRRSGGRLRGHLFP